MTWTRRIWNLLRSNRVSRDIEREMAFHIAERTDDLVARGVPADVAEARARRAFGHRTTLRERTRAEDIGEWLQSVAGDLRYAARGLARAPVFTVAAIASLGLGVGANTTIFSLLDALLLRPLDVPRPGELYQVAPDTGKGSGGYFTYPQWAELRQRQAVFQHVATFGGTRFNLAAGGEAKKVTGEMVAGDYFTMVGARPSQGRLLGPSDDRRGCAGVAVLSARFAQRTYGSRMVAGTALRLSSVPFTIVGVLAPTYRGVEVGKDPDVFIPVCATELFAGQRNILDERSRWFLRVVGRLRPNETAAHAQVALTAVSAAAFAATLPGNYSRKDQQEYLQRRFTLHPATRGLSSARTEYGKQLLALMVAVTLVLLIACANVANLLLARAESRQSELSVRLAIGAGRRRVVRQLITESALLATVGAAVGIAVAQWSTSWLLLLLPRQGPATELVLDLAPNGRLLLFAIIVTVLTVLVSGVIPAWRATGQAPQGSLKAQGRGSVPGANRWALGKGLVAGQVALSLVLLAGAVLFVSTFRTLSHSRPGFEPSGLLLVEADLHRALTDTTRRGVLRQQLLDRSRAIPGVVRASSHDVTPVSGSSWNDVILVEGEAERPFDKSISFMNEVADGYFATMETPFRQGRDFSQADRAGPDVAIVNEAWARKFLTSGSPIGRRFRLQVGDSTSAPVTIIGVVQDAKYNNLREPDEAIVYRPSLQAASVAPATTLVLRTRGDPMALAPAVRQMVREIDPGISIEFDTMSNVLTESLQVERLLAQLSAAFGMLASLLAMVGLYGVMAYTVARRRGELGVRVALGAGRERVVRLVLRDVTKLVGIGVVAGTGLGLVVARSVRSMLYGVQPTDVGVWVLAITLLALSALVAGFIPAWRAASVDPLEALRAE